MMRALVASEATTTKAAGTEVVEGTTAKTGAVATRIGDRERSRRSGCARDATPGPRHQVGSPMFADWPQGYESDRSRELDNDIQADRQNRRVGCATATDEKRSFAVPLARKPVRPRHSCSLPDLSEVCKFATT